MHKHRISLRQRIGWHSMPTDWAMVHVVSITIAPAIGIGQMRQFCVHHGVLMGVGTQKTAPRTNTGAGFSATSLPNRR
jgi:hypothetical protein